MNDSSEAPRDLSLTALKYDKRWATARRKWTSFVEVQQYLSKKISGSAAHPNVVSALAHKCAAYIGAPVERGISVGCGLARTEMELLKQGIVQSFVLYDVSSVARENALNEARRFGLEARVDYRVGDGMALNAQGEFDLVFWKSSLHHMHSAYDAIKWSQTLLSSSGTFFGYDYVGPSRFAYEQPLVDACNAVLQTLPAHVFEVEHEGLLKKRPRRMKFITPDQVAANDPTEAADSAQILPSFRKLCTGGTVVPIGGTVARLVLDQYGRFMDPETDKEVVRKLLAVDDAFSAYGVFHNALLLYKAP